MSWKTFEIKDKKWNVRYTPISDGKLEMPVCDIKGNILERAKSKNSKEIKDEVLKLVKDEETRAKIINIDDGGYYFNPITKERVDRAEFRMGEDNKPKAKMNQTKDVNKYVYVDMKPYSDIQTEAEYLAESEELYNHLKQENKAIRFNFSFGTGFNKVSCVIFPLEQSPYLQMVAGQKGKTERIKELIAQTEEYKVKRNKLNEIDSQIASENKINLDEDI